MHTITTHATGEKLQPEELCKLDELDRARSSAEGLLTAVVFNAQDELSTAAPGLWRRTTAWPVPTMKLSGTWGTYWASTRCCKRLRCSHRLSSGPLRNWPSCPAWPMPSSR